MISVFKRLTLTVVFCGFLFQVHVAKAATAVSIKNACLAVLRFFPISRTIVERITRPSDAPRFQTLTRIENSPEIDLVEMRKLYLRDSAAMLTLLKSKYDLTVLLTDTHMTHREAIAAPLIGNWPSFWQYFKTPFGEMKKIADAQKYYQAFFQANPLLGIYFAPHSPILIGKEMAFTLDRPFVDRHLILIPQHASRLVILHEFLHSRIAAHRFEVTGDIIPHRSKLLINAFEASPSQFENSMVKVVRDYFDEELALDEWMLNNRSALNFSEAETKWLLTRYLSHTKEMRSMAPEGIVGDSLVQEYRQSFIRFVKKDPSLLKMSLQLGLIRAKEK